MRRATRIISRQRAQGRVFPCRAQRGRARRRQPFSTDLSRPREHDFGEDRRRAGQADHLPHCWEKKSATASLPKLGQMCSGLGPQ